MPFSQLPCSVCRVAEVGSLSVLAVLVAWAVWKNRAELLAALRDFGQMLADIWNRLFGGTARQRTEAVAEQSARQPSLPRFADYKDPFAAGTAGRYPPGELVRYTFDALEAWARDGGHPRQPDQTPHEFVRSLAGEASSLAADAAYSGRVVLPCGLRPRHTDGGERGSAVGVVARDEEGNCPIVRSPAFRRWFDEENRLKPELRTVIASSSRGFPRAAARIREIPAGHFRFIAPQSLAQLRFHATIVSFRVAAKERGTPIA